MSLLFFTLVCITSILTNDQTCDSVCPFSREFAAKEILTAGR